jgi:hypothetical protein
MTCSSFSTQYIIIVGLLKLQYILITEIMYAKGSLCGYRQVIRGRTMRIRDNEPLDSIRKKSTAAMERKAFSQRGVCCME